MSVRLIADLEEFAALRREWAEVLRRSDHSHVFMTWEWCFTWWRHFANGRKLFILGVQDGSELISVFPLMLTTSPHGHGLRNHRVRYLHFIGFRYEQRWNDCMDIVGVRQSSVMDPVLDYLRQRQHLWDLLDLWDIDETSITVSLLRESASRLGLPVVSTSSIEPRPYLATPSESEWRSYYRGTISQRLRQNIERRTRLLKQHGALAFVKAEPATMMSHLASLFELYQKCEASRNKSVMFSRAVYRDFYQSLAQTCPFDWLDCPTLELNGKAIAASFGFRYNSRLLGSTMAFDPEYAQLAPGTILLRHMIEDCFADDGIQELDFGSGGEAYKYEWTATQRAACQVLIGNAFAGDWVRKVLRKSPVAVRRLLVPPLTAWKGLSAAFTRGRRGEERRS